MRPNPLPGPAPRSRETVTCAGPMLARRRAPCVLVRSLRPVRGAFAAISSRLASRRDYRRLSAHAFVAASPSDSPRGCPRPTIFYGGWVTGHAVQSVACRCSRFGSDSGWPPCCVPAVLASAAVASRPRSSRLPATPVTRDLHTTTSVQIGGRGTPVAFRQLLLSTRPLGPLWIRSASFGLLRGVHLRRSSLRRFRSLPSASRGLPWFPLSQHHQSAGEGLPTGLL